MVPVMEQLKETYRGRLIVEFYDVKKDHAMRKKYQVRLLPTQIFLNTAGEEVYRHEGYFPFDEIVPVLENMGVNIAR